MTVLVGFGVGGSLSSTRLHCFSLDPTWVLPAGRVWLGVFALNRRVLCFFKLN